MRFHLHRLVCLCSSYMLHIRITIMGNPPFVGCAMSSRHLFLLRRYFCLFLSGTVVLAPRASPRVLGVRSERISPTVASEMVAGMTGVLTPSLTLVCVGNARLRLLVCRNRVETGTCTLKSKVYTSTCSQMIS